MIIDAFGGSTVKKSLMIVLSLCLLLNCFSFSSSAINTIPEAEFGGYEEITGNDVAVDLSSLKSERKIKLSKGAFPTSGLYYDQLNDKQKEVYNALLSLPVGESVFTIEYEYGELITPANTNDARNIIRSIVTTAYYAFLRDHAEIFWFNGSSFSWTYWTVDDTYSISKITFTAKCHSSYTFDTVAELYDKLMNVVDNFQPAGVTRYEKLRSIHDYIVTTATYDPNYQNENASPYRHQPTGCLLEPYLCVCEGYAEAFKILADKAGIPCMRISSNSHTWNAVLMEDGKWYAIDSTWDDPMTTDPEQTYVLRYNYFLVGSKTLTDGEVPFSESDSHIEQIFYTDYAGNSLLYPTLSETAYAPFNPIATRRNDGISDNDYPGGSILQSENIVFLSPGKAIEDCFDFNPVWGGSVTDYTGSVTGSSLTFTTEDGDTVLYTVIVHGDVNGDGASDAFDLYELNLSMNNIKLLQGAYYRAAELTNDGIVDLSDYAIIKNYMGGTFNYY